jgi:hypothetical protein
VLAGAQALDRAYPWHDQATSDSIEIIGSRFPDALEAHAYL